MEKISKEKKVVFIDLDDTLIEPFSGSDFPKCIADMKLIWKTWNALRDWANGRNDWKVFIVTNQAGIARGFVDEDLWKKKVEYIRAALFEYLGKSGVVDYMYCTDDNKDNPMRKPNPGMLSSFWLLACQGSIDMSEAVMIGDAAGKEGDFSDSDLKAAENFGIDFIDVDDL